jgi:Phage derived protein Gp49-like (DUF891)
VLRLCQSLQQCAVFVVKPQIHGHDNMVPKWYYVEIPARYPGLTLIGIMQVIEDQIITPPVGIMPVMRRSRRSAPRSWCLTITSIATIMTVIFLVGLLAEQAENLGEPYTRHPGGKVRELRFHLLAQQARVTYWLAPGCRVILTVFRKTRSAETALR